MTREEAITILKDISWQMGSVKRWENIEAIDMAIEALYEPKLYTHEEVWKEDDLISRADAIERLLSFKESRAKGVGTYDIGFVDGISHSINMIDIVPSADRPSGEWQRVDEQPYFRKHYHKVCCSVCHKQGSEKYNYCPSCGARMENTK